MTGTVSFECIAGVIRYHPKGGYGDPYTFSCVAVINNEEAILKGAIGEYSKDVHRTVKDTLTALGVKRVKYERRDEYGKTRYVVLEE